MSEKVIVTKASESGGWYDDKIGEIFDVISPESVGMNGMNDVYYVDRPTNEYGTRVAFVNKPDCEPVTLHNGAYYREVKRKAREGELVKIVDASSWSDYSNGYIAEVTDVVSDINGSIEITDEEGDNEGVWLREYAVLEPVAHEAPADCCVDETQASPEVVAVDANDASPSVCDMLANLATRLTKMEREVRDQANNLRTFAEQSEKNAQAIAKINGDMLSFTEVAEYAKENSLQALEQLAEDDGATFADFDELQTAILRADLALVKLREEQRHRAVDAVLAARVSEDTVPVRDWKAPGDYAEYGEGDSE